MKHSRLFQAILVLSLTPTFLFAGGPLIVGGPAVGTRAKFGIDGQPFTWNPAKMPIQYRVDPGPMAATSSGTTVISNATGLQRVQAMFGTWSAVQTAQISFTNAGGLLTVGSYTGGDLKSVAQYNDMIGSCRAGTQSPIIFDADGSIIAGLGLPPEVIGFSQPCSFDTTNGYITSDAILMNGRMQDGITSSSTTSPNYEISASQFDEAITHEMGHFLGLDHSQINLNLLTNGGSTCSIDDQAGLPLMFPIEFCAARKDVGLPLLAPDDVAWISTLYPAANFNTSYAMISGTIVFPDGVSPMQGANVIARMMDDPTTPEDESRRIAVSVVSGYKFTGNPGQDVTGDNSGGSPIGSRDAQLIGYYQVFVPPGTYTIEVESVYPQFTSGSSVGPLDPPTPLPGPPEFWKQNESVFDLPLQRDTITVHAGDKVTGIDIILNGTMPRFDQYEDSGALYGAPMFRLSLEAEEVRA